MARVFRPLEVGDLPLLLDVQEPGAVAGLSAVFPQDAYPFPRDAVLQRWRDELSDPAVSAYVASDETGELIGFAARRGDEVLHFGTAVQTWGSGLATWLLGQLLATFEPGLAHVRLWVFTDNGRGRRFYENHGWRPTGGTTRSAFAPYPELLEYAFVIPPDRAQRSLPMIP